jgi:hypothetical protein
MGELALKGQRIIHFFMEKGLGIISCGQVFFVHKRIVSKVKECGVY